MRFNKILVSSLVLLLPSTVASSQTLTHYYDFNGSQVTDKIGSANGSMVGSATLAGGLLHLNGSTAYVTLSEKIVPFEGAPFSLFIRYAADTQSEAITELLSQGYSGGPGFYIGQENGNLRVTDSYAWNSGVAFPTGSHNILITSGASGTRIYLDGNVVLASNATLNLHDNGGGSTTIIGKQFNPYGEYFKGSVDELKIFSDVVSYAVANNAQPAGGSSTATYNYDALGRLTKVTTLKSNGSVVQTTYDLDRASNRTRVQTTGSN